MSKTVAATALDVTESLEAARLIVSRLTTKLTLSKSYRDTLRLVTTTTPIARVSARTLVAVELAFSRIKHCSALMDEALGKTEKSYGMGLAAWAEYEVAPGMGLHQVLAPAMAKIIESFERAARGCEEVAHLSMQLETELDTFFRDFPKLTETD
jgi:hypothetical protein